MNQDRCPAAAVCPGKVVCRCLQVTEETLLSALATFELHTIKDIRQHTGAGDGCTACHRVLRQYLVKQEVPAG